MRGRGTPENPPNRYERIFVEPDLEEGEPGPPIPTEYYRDASRTILAENDSPDIPFRWSLNPYRGCEHGCSYCYARPSHEYLGFSAGLDFETRLMVKEDAPELLRKKLSSPRWQPETISLSGNTDAYQPLERRLKITRRCLEVLAEFRNPVDVITKSALVARDADLLGELAGHGAARAMISVTTLDADLAGRLEPRAARPERRLEAVRALSDAGVPVGVMVAPVIPGLTDEEIPSILEAAAEAGAHGAAWILLRLPAPVDRLFQDWLEHHFPDRKDKVMGRLRQCRDGRVTDARFGRRMRGHGPYADQLAALFRTAARRLKLDRSMPAPSSTAFRRPGQQHLLF